MERAKKIIPFRAAEWWNSKIASLCGLIYLFAFANKLKIETFLSDFLFLITWMIFAASFGFYINDVFDIEKDSIAGKKNFAQSHSTFKKYFISGFLCIAIFLNWFLLSKSILVGILIGSQLLLFLLYSSPFFRLKEKPLLGVIADAIYAYVIPGWVILTVITDSCFGNNHLLFFCYISWLIVAGSRNIISHHVEDYENDMQTGTVTSATYYGYEQMLKVLKIIIPFFEVILFITFLCLQVGGLEYLTLFYLIYLVYVAVRELKSDLWSNQKIAIKQYNLLYNFFNEFYEKWLPPLILILLVFRENVYSILLIIHLLIFSKVTTDFLIDYSVLKPVVILYFQRLYWNLQRIYFYFQRLHGYLPRLMWRLSFHMHGLFWKIHKVVSLSVNYSIYYLFLLFKINLKENEKRKQLKQPKQSVTDTRPLDVERIKQTKESIQDSTKADSILKAETTAVYSIGAKISNELKEKNVHGLWIGDLLSSFELMTIYSFIEKGYTFHLWLYMPLQNKLPENVIICDANKIIPEDKIFRYKKKSQFGTGKGSFAGFSDIFRYKLLYDVGGWWVDMDVTCLKPFDVDAPYFFRGHHSLPMVGSVMKVPKASELMLKCYTEAEASIDSNNTDWHKPIEIMINNIREFALEEFIINDISNKDVFSQIELYLFTNEAVPDNWYFIHWCNEVFRTNHIPKNLIKYDSTVGELMRRYEIMPVLSGIEKQKYDKKVQMKLLERKFLVYL